MNSSSMSSFHAELFPLNHSFGSPTSNESSKMLSLSLYLPAFHPSRLAGAPGAEQMKCL